MSQGVTKGECSHQMDEEFAETLYKKFYSKMFGVACKMTGSEHAAEDVVQDAFLEVVKRSAFLMDLGEKQRAAYLMATLKSRAYNHFRREKKFFAMEDEILSNQLEPDRDTYDVALRNIQYQKAGELVRRLPEQLRLVFMLRYYYDLTHAEIARLAGISDKAVHVYIYRAKKKIKKLAAKEGCLDE